MELSTGTLNIMFSRLDAMHLQVQQRAHHLNCISVITENIKCETTYINTL